MNWINGLLDSESVREYDKKFNEVHQDSQSIRQLSRDSTIFAKENIMLNAKKYEYMIKNHLELKGQFDDHHKQYLILEKRQRLINNLEYLTRAWFLEHKFLAEQITKYLEGAIFGKFPQLISIEQFTRDLEELERLLPNKQKLPINLNKENALNIFKFASTRAIIYGENMFIEISIPKVEIDVYTAYEIIPIPFTIGNASAIILPAMTHFLFNHNTGDYIPIQEAEYKLSIENAVGEKIIKPRDNIFHDFRDSCEMYIFMNTASAESLRLCNVKVIPTSNYFIPLNYINEYYVSTQSTVTLHEFCFRKPLSKQTIDTSGILTLTENCRVRSKEITITPRISTTVHSGKIISLTTDFNNMSLETISEQIQNISTALVKDGKNVPRVLIKNYLADFTDLTKKADELIERAQIEGELRAITEHTSQVSWWDICCTFVVPIINILIVVLMIVLRSRYRQKRAATVIISNNQPMNEFK